MDRKAEIRLQINDKKRLLTPDYIVQASQNICSKIELNQNFQKALTIVSYWPLAKEVDVVQLNKKYCSAKTILLPSIINDEIVLKHFSKDCIFTDGILGIKEPVGEAYTRLEEIDLVLLPGIAFDKDMNRLGRGKSYYDRFLKKIEVYKIGICFGFQYLSHIPIDDHDVPVDEIIFD